MATANTVHQFTSGAAGDLGHRGQPGTSSSGSPVPPCGSVEELLALRTALSEATHSKMEQDRRIRDLEVTMSESADSRSTRRKFVRE